MSTLPDIKKDFPAWYQEVIFQAELVDHSPVRGSMVIRPYGYAIWEHIQAILDRRIKETGHQNAAFPLLIPESFFKKEAEHVKGFAPELVVVTHAGGKKLKEPLVIRPTSETIVHYMFAKWIKSWRDLPLKINQWANIVRWELRPRPFLRTTEIFWQEGHTAHETLQEAENEVNMMMQEYVTLVQDVLAIPVVTGLKSEQEKFPGAKKTLTLEALMQDGKALQMGTSHLLSQSFAKAFDMKFQDRQENIAYPYLTSWGVTTRLIGAVVMTHGDEKGLVLPPKVAPIQVVIIPIFKKGHDNAAILQAARHVETECAENNIRVFVDDDESKTPGAKFYHWELKGVPVRVEIGPRDMETKQAMVADRLGLGKKAVLLDTIAQELPILFDDIQQHMFERARVRMHNMWHKAEKLAEFGSMLEKEGGFYQTSWCGNAACEDKLKKFKATIRCILEGDTTFPTCFHCGATSTQEVLVAKAY